MKLVIPNDSSFPWWKRKLGEITMLFHQLQDQWYTLKVYEPWAVFLLKIWMLIASVGALGIIGSFSWIILGGFGPIPNPADLKDIKNNLATEVYAADSSLLGRYYFENRSYIPYHQISPPFIHALVATEDARFFHHNGVDLRSSVRVLIKSILIGDRSSGGGSTISQQLAKNLYPRENFGGAIPTLIINKLKEIIIARRLEKCYSKAEIMELYLNTVPFSDNTYGIKVAAHQFFKVLPSQLDESQSAVLVAMLKATSSYHPINFPERSRERRNLVLRQMARFGYLGKKDLDSLQNSPLNLHYSPLNNNEGPATYFREHLRLVLKDLLQTIRKPNGSAYNLYTDGLKIYTSIDARLQQYAEKAVKDHLIELQQSFYDHLGESTPWENDTTLLMAIWRSDRYRTLLSKGQDSLHIDSVFRHPIKMTVFDWERGEQQLKMSPLDSIKYYLSLLNAGFLAIDPHLGQVKAWVGGINHKYFQYDNVKARRQVGSTFKPIVYAAALQHGIHPCWHIPNTKRTYWRHQAWRPKNSDDTYGGWYSMEGGLINSMNTISVNLTMRARPSNVAQLAENMGISDKVPRYPAIALGAVDASLWDMLKVYGTLANRGLSPELSYIKRIETQQGEVLMDFETAIDTCEWRQSLSMDEADLINQMLQAAVDKGTARRLRYRYQFTNQLAGKTGTSQNHSDGWFIGYTPKLVAGVWVGAQSPNVRFRDLRLGQGANTALPVFANFLTKINEDPSLENYKKASFPTPSDEVLAALNCKNVIWPARDSSDTQSAPAIADSVAIAVIPTNNLPASTLTATKETKDINQ
ncbi:MAG: transglycosylase domain-containing protein [Saprospiraceae bacterium]